MQVIVKTITNSRIAAAEGIGQVAAAISVKHIVNIAYDGVHASCV